LLLLNRAEPKIINSFKFLNYIFSSNNIQNYKILSNIKMVVYNIIFIIKNIEHEAGIRKKLNLKSAQGKFTHQSNFIKI
jgi:hypothetical protein